MRLATASYGPLQNSLINDRGPWSSCPEHNMQRVSTLVRYSLMGAVQVERFLPPFTFYSISHNCHMRFTGQELYYVVSLLMGSSCLICQALQQAQLTKAAP